MLALRDIMTRNVLTLRPDSTLRDAIELFSGNHISGAPVVDGGMLLGVVSSIDVMDTVAAEKRLHAVAGEPWANGDDDPTDAETETANWFTAWDDADASLGRFADAARSEEDLLDELTVADAMTRNIAELPPDSEIHAAAAYMLERGIHRVLVVENGRLQGLVSTTDFLRVIAERRL